MRFRIQGVILLALLFIYAGCTTNPPVETGDSDKQHVLTVTADLDSAMIFVDSISTGKYAPQEIELLPGNHIITLKRANFSDISQGVYAVSGLKTSLPFVFPTRTVLLEDFANVSCAPCVPANVLLEKIKSSTYKANKMISVKFATNFPSPQDPFYLAIPQICAARRTFYAVGTVPTYRVDGINKITSPDSFNVKAAIQKQLAIPPKFKFIDRQILFSQTTCTVNTSIECINASGVDFANLIVHVLLVENKITYPTPPGNNGETEFYNVVRAQLPTEAGQTVPVLTAGQKHNVSVSTDLSSAWQAGRIFAVVFLQDKVTKEVFNSMYISNLAID